MPKSVKVVRDFDHAVRRGFPYGVQAAWGKTENCWPFEKEMPQKNAPPSASCRIIGAALFIMWLGRRCSQRTLLTLLRAADRQMSLIVEALLNGCSSQG
jgi:hypothetical protein